MNLILERPLNRDQILQMQTELKDMKFMDADPTGVLDDATLLGIGFWHEYRSSAVHPFRFYRTAFTQNLFDRVMGLGKQ